MVILHLMERLLLIIFAIVIGSRPVYNENFAIITGSINMTGSVGDSSERGQVSLSYPQGFNKDNCVIVSIMTQNTNINLGYSSGTLSSYDYPASINNAGIGRNAILKETEILFNIYYRWAGQLSENRTDTYKFKIVLMKLPTGDEANLLGDVNLDGVVNQEDLNWFTSYLPNGGSITFEQYANADMTKDGQITSADYVELRNRLN